MMKGFPMIILADFLKAPTQYECSNISFVTALTVVLNYSSILYIQVYYCLVLFLRKLLHNFNRSDISVNTFILLVNN